MIADNRRVRRRKESAGSPEPVDLTGGNGSGGVQVRESSSSPSSFRLIDKRGRQCSCFAVQQMLLHPLLASPAACVCKSNSRSSIKRISLPDFVDDDVVSF